MRLSLLLIPLLSLPLLPAVADPDVEVKLQQIKDIGILPEEKLAYRPEEKLTPSRTNPFAERSKAREAKTVETVETEEIKIRRVFDTLQVTGLTKFKGKYSALLGDLIIEEGARIAPVIPNQTQILRVTRVTDKQVELAWVEGAGSETVVPRKIIKRVELSPKVGVLLAAQPPGSSDPNAMTYLDENGKVIWPRKMTPDIEGLSLPATSTAALSAGEEAALMETSPPPETPGRTASPAMAEAPFTPLAEDSAGGAPLVDPATGVEDAVEPAAADDAGETPPADAPSGS